MSRIAGIYWDDTAAAPGISLSVYFSGCHFHCPECHNPEAQDFNYGVELDKTLLKEIVVKLNKNGVKRTLSILGGEPLCPENRAAVADLIELCHNNVPDLKIYIWTGYAIEELFAEHDELIDSIILRYSDCIIDGRYEKDKRDTRLPLRGSSNQRIIYLDRGLA